MSAPPRPAERGRPSQGRQLAASVLALTAASGVVACGGEEDDPSGQPVGAPVRAPELARPQLVAWRSGHQLVRAGADGRGLRVLVGRSAGRGPPAAQFQPATWSPNGRRLAYTTSGPLGFKVDIYVMRADGSRRRRVTSDRRSAHPLWSLDGMRIYFSRDGAIWSIRPDGSDPRQVTSPADGRYDIPGSFAPDGGTLAFTRGARVEPGAGGRVPNTREVWLARPDGSEARRLAARSQDPAFSPDGRRIAFVSDRDENGELSYADRVFFASELYVMGADGSGPRRLTRTRALNERQPSWLPNGRRLAYQRGRTYQNAEATVVMQANADGSCPTRVFAYPGRDRWPWYAAPTWRPGNARSGDGTLAC